MVASLTQPVTSSLKNVITRRGQEGGFLPLLALLLMMTVLEKGVTGAVRGYNNLDKIFTVAPSSKQYRDY